MPEMYALLMFDESKFLMKYPRQRIVSREPSNFWTNLISSFVLLGS